MLPKGFEESSWGQGGQERGASGALAEGCSEAPSQVPWFGEKSLPLPGLGFHGVDG